MSGNESTESTVGSRLRAARELAGLSQGQVAKEMRLHRPSISEVEAGRRKVSSQELLRFAEIYAVDIEWLASGDSREANSEGERVQLAARELAKLKPEDVDRLLSILKTIRKDRDSEDD
jgi:transcriptional regulator with XRE-family HTH domain